MCQNSGGGKLAVKVKFNGEKKEKQNHRHNSALFSVSAEEVMGF